MAYHLLGCWVPGIGVQMVSKRKHPLGILLAVAFNGGRILHGAPFSFIIFGEAWQGDTIFDFAIAGQRPHPAVTR